MQNLFGSSGFLELSCTCELIRSMVESRNCAAGPSVLDLGLEVLYTNNRGKGDTGAMPEVSHRDQQWFPMVLPYTLLVLVSDVNSLERYPLFDSKIVRDLAAAGSSV